MEEKNETKNQNLYLKNREALTIDSVKSVETFDSEGVTLSTALGNFIVEGENLRIESLSKEDEKIYIVGKITGMYYTTDPGKQNRGFFKGLFK